MTTNDLVNFNLNHIVRYALTLKGSSGQKLTARALNTADTIRLKQLNKYQKHHLWLIFSYEAGTVHSFEEYMKSQETTSWYQEAHGLLDTKSITLVFGSESDATEAISQDPETFSNTLKTMAKKQGVFIAERVCFQD